ncbi:MAG: hypothetical protein JWM21_4655 [Acidobacteria bacterium]|nr:hypothetical protein [Acidobacteriota bacterium]
MLKPRVSAFISILVIAVFSGAAVLNAQTLPAPTTDTTTQTEEQKQKEKEVLENKAAVLLEQIVGEVQMLKLPENRIRVQIAAGDLLWQRNEARARSMFSLASDGVAEMMHSTDPNSRRWALQMRQELVMTAAQHDASLAYQIVAATRSPAADSDSRRGNADLMLEHSLLAQVATLDPKLAVQKAEEALAKDQFPYTLPRVLSELQVKDKEAFAQLSEKVLSRLQAANMLVNTEAGGLALTLLQPGPRAADNGLKSDSASTSQTRVSSIGPVLSQSAFTDLMGTVIDAALRATRQGADAQRGGNQRGGNSRGRGPGGLTNDQSAPTDAQIEQSNARRLLFGLQGLLPQIDQYVPLKATAVRQKLTEIGAGNPQAGYNQLGNLMRQGTSDMLLSAAPAAPQQVQDRLYQQAALKALDEGNADRARQIANDHLDGSTRDVVLQKVDLRLIAGRVEADNMDQLRQALAALHSDDERIDLLLQMAGKVQKADAQTDDKKLALKLLGEAQRLSNRHATDYRQLDQQLKVAEAFATVETARSFEVLDPGINQLNELLSAAAVLSGFEVNIFKDGELPLESGSELGSMVTRYGQELARLAKLDFERAETSANKFQLVEPRLLVRLMIVRNVMGVPQVGGFNNAFGGRGFVRRPQ